MPEGIHSAKWTLIGAANSVIQEAVPEQRAVAESLISPDVTDIIARIRTGLQDAIDGTVALRDKHGALMKQAEDAAKTSSDARDRIIKVLGSLSDQSGRISGVGNDGTEIVSFSKEISPLIGEMDPQIDPISLLAAEASAQLSLLELFTGHASSEITERIHKIATNADNIKVFAEGLD
jgi:hypothetical protein